MSISAILDALNNTALAAIMRGEAAGWGWAFPIVEVMHVMALALVFGTILMVDLRLLGLISRNNPVSKLSTELLPWTWTAFGCAAVTGSLLFMSKAHTYFHNTPFRFKFLCMALAGINMLVFHFGAYRRVNQWDNTLPPPTAARIAGAFSVALWLGVIFFGRWIGFTI